MKLEDYFLPSVRSWPLDWLSHHPHQSSSQSTQPRDPPPPILAFPANSANSVVEDSASATGEVVEKSSPSPVVPASGQRTSVYRGVTRHRWTGRFEAHLWDNTCKREGQKRKGRQGGYDKEDKAARAYDLAALKYWGLTATTNFPVKNYANEIEEMKNMSKQEFIASLRRKSSGFSRGASIYRGVTRHHQHGRWQARIGRVAGNKDLYLGTFTTEEEAAEAYDVAAIKFRGANAVTNFELSRYDMEAIASTELPIGGSAKRSKQSVQSNSDYQFTENNNSAISLQTNGYTTGFLRNLLEFPSGPASSPAPMACLSFGEAGANVYIPSLNWLTANSQYDNQINCNQSTLESDLTLMELLHS
ncbi:hypothetical protein J5N97_015433 [Dioscorea zingiberensis]|uniref:AP2/ERF domain-containing protein n=1 Tax=Dioscorea zingiberensis TaxID=325984 RepID=A0A9D5CVQ2_9LILI|nr:hypothetical protein J5N97_015433 [Dioscorea zingiberensis]